ncbi:CBS domain-containing protein [Pullulanibacillus sp. KACC 23026]|uniref:CBS domain-containing protein n=1 Tax=Pullulanibacillus sp. KACC 23026 TaxID=3028315 RepID=UPI0023B155BE|nr:CBS domain-containing protein [Pullulanibacillus sp. KACC 23026]WEG11402.1 CBS domain-containing protein [Pullulanibacillus sp. KACC 23026]
MFVKSIIIPKHRVLFVTKGSSAGKTLKFLEDNQIDGVPVLDGDTYLGLVTRWSIYESGFKSGLDQQAFLETVKVEDIAIKKNAHIDDSDVFEETLLKVKDVPFVPVLDDQNKFVGIVTRYDVLEQFQSAFGMKHKGIRIAFSSVEVEGRLARLAKITHDFHQNIISLATFDETDKLVRRLVMRIEPSADLDKYLNKLEKNGFQILDVKSFE